MHSYNVTSGNLYATDYGTLTSDRSDRGIFSYARALQVAQGLVEQGFHPTINPEK